MYRVVFTKAAEKEYKKLHNTNRKIFTRIRRAILDLSENPKEGKPLKFKLKGKWSYRIGEYRIIYSIENRIFTVYVLDIGHRSDIYR